MTSRGPARFDTSRRLAKPADFRRIFQRPCRSVDQWFTVLFRANDLPHPRLGLAVTRKRVKGAVSRHRIKRQIRESFRLNQNLLLGLDLVVLAREHLQREDNRALRASLEWHWRQLEKQRCSGS